MPTSPAKVYCYPVTPDSAYVPLLFRGTGDRYRPVYRDDATIADAVADLRRGECVILHIHWEEFVLRSCVDEASADAAVAGLTALLDAVKGLGGPIVWTVHNEVPHVIAYRRQFLRARALMAARADVVLVHDAPAVERLAAQVNLDGAKVRIFPHPSYLDEHEDDAALRRGLDRSPDRVIQGFGWIRRQKGFGDMIAMLDRDFLAARQATIRISGADVELAAVQAESPGRDDVIWDVRHVPAADVPALLRSAACLVLPYERMLTSGAALVAMSVGVPLVAVDVPAMRALLPLRGRSMLYPPGDAAGLRAIVARLLDLSAIERQAIVADNLAIAKARHPRRIAQALARIYDRLLDRPTPADAPDHPAPA